MHFIRATAGRVQVIELPPLRSASEPPGTHDAVNRILPNHKVYFL